MLGLVNTVSSGSVPESKYSLSLDGTDDYLDLGETFNSVFQGNFSILVWVNFADKDPSTNEYVFGSEIGTEDAISFSLNTDQNYNFYFKANNDAANTNEWATGYNNGDDGETGWQHFVFVVKNRGGTNVSQILVYQNAVLKIALTSGLTADNHAAFTSTNLFLGARNNDGTAELFSNSKINDFAIWNTLLDGDAVTAIYNSGKPTNLTFDSGNYNNSSALQAYYKMGNGRFDDKANGVVHDQHNPGFEDDLIAANGGLTGSFTSDDFTHNSDGTMTIGGGSGNKNWAGGSIDGNSTYKVTVDIVSGATGKFFIGGTSSTPNFSENGDNTRYIRSTASSSLTFVSFNDCDGMVVRSLTVEKLKGFPGLTSGDVTFSSDTP